jgi:quinol monooxygenase YgiN
VIIIAGTIDLADPGRLDECMAKAGPLQQATRDDEAGCLAYCFSADPCVAGRIQVYELWTDETSLAAHFQHENYRAMGAVLRSYLKAADNRKYRCVLSEPVYDTDHRPRADFFTATS